MIVEQVIQLSEGFGEERGLTLQTATGRLDASLGGVNLCILRNH